MKKLNFKYITLFIAAAAIVGCDDGFKDTVTDEGFYSSGTADFSKYVTLGNSLTAGFSDGALYLDAQKQSFPAIVAGQMALAGGGDFNQPLVNDNAGGLLLNGVQVAPNRFVLSTLTPAGAPRTSPSPTVYTGEAPTTDAAVKVTGPFNNFGVPGAKSFHLNAPGYGQLNPYFGRFSSDANASIIGDAEAAGGTFFTLWIGNNDILSYATSGGVGVDTNETGNVNPTTYGPNDITNTNVFTASYTAQVAALTRNGAKGALVNLPDVTSIPFFTTVPFNAIPLDAGTAAFVNSNYAQYNGAMALYQQGGAITAAERAARTINFAAGQNAVVILDKFLTNLPNPTVPGTFLPKLRQATAADLITFPTAGILGTLANPADPTSVIGVAVPLADGNVLTSRERALVTAAQASFNATIQALATANDLAFVDVRSVLAQAANGGVTFNGGVLTSTYATGGGFSLDGVHPTPRGYALVSNIIIDAVNAKYGSTLPKVDIGTYRSIMISDRVTN
jgi:hypothetical protein